MTRAQVHRALRLIALLPALLAPAVVVVVDATADAEASERGSARAGIVLSLFPR